MSPEEYQAYKAMQERSRALVDEWAYLKMMCQLAEKYC
jgi:hypothetical protein